MRKSGRTILHVPTAANSRRSRLAWMVTPRTAGPRHAPFSALPGSVTGKHLVQRSGIEHAFGPEGDLLWRGPAESGSGFGRHGAEATSEQAHKTALGVETATRSMTGVAREVVRGAHQRKGVGVGDQRPKSRVRSVSLATGNSSVWRQPKSSKPKSSGRHAGLSSASTARLATGQRWRS